MTCEHASVRMSAGTTRRDGSRLQRCLLCNMYRRRYGDGSFGAWHDRAGDMPEPRRREPTEMPAPSISLQLRPPSEPEPVRVERSRPSPLVRVFSAEIVALARQLSAKRLEVDVLAMRLDRAVENYNAAHGIGAPEPALALVGVYPP